MYTTVSIPCSVCLLFENFVVDYESMLLFRVVWGTGTPKDIDEVNRREVSECDG
jgi:hypothetical protein